MIISVSLVLDVLLALLLLGMVHKAYRQGFLASFIRLVGSGASFILAALMSKPTAIALYDRFLEGWVLRYVEEKLLPNSDGLSQAMAEVAKTGEAALGILEAMLQELHLDFYSQGDAGQLGRTLLNRLSGGSDPAQAVAEVAVRPMVLTVLNLGVFFVIFGVAMLLVRFLMGLGLGVNHVPLVGGLNRLAGLLCGTAYAALVGYLLVMVLVFLCGVSQNQWEYLNTEILQNTHLIRWFMGIKAVLP